MGEQNYFSRNLTGGAISQRGFRYQTLVSIKYLIDSLDDPDFEALAAEQEDDFSLIFSNRSVQCQVKSILLDLRGLRNYLNSVRSISTPKALIYSAFSNDIHSLLETRKWYEFRIENHRFRRWENTDELTRSYIEQLAKKQIDFQSFQSTVLDAIPVDYSEAIVKNAITVWAKANQRNINIEKFMQSLYVEISKIAAHRGILKRSEIINIADRCTETRRDVCVALDLMESDNLSTRDDVPSNRWISYTERRVSGCMCIQPVLRYWDEILSGLKPMFPISYTYEPFASELPNLDIKVLNNSDQTLYLTAIELGVACSKPNPSPLLYLKKPDLSSNKRHLALHNEGWGTLENSRIQINVTPVETSDFSSYGASEDLGTIEGYRNIDLTGMLQTLTGIDFDLFDKALAREYQRHRTHNRHRLFGADWDEDSWNNPKRYAGLFRQYLGQYSKGIAYINGVLDFDADTIEAQKCHYSIKFSAPIFLYDYSLAGAPFPPSYQYDISLQVSGENYTVRKAISQELKPGEIDRFNLRIHCHQSSRHVMDICLIDITGRRIPIEHNVQLDMCIPRSGIRHFCKGEN